MSKFIKTNSYRIVILTTSIFSFLGILTILVSNNRNIKDLNAQIANSQLNITSPETNNNLITICADGISKDDTFYFQKEVGTMNGEKKSITQLWSWDQVELKELYSKEKFSFLLSPQKADNDHYIISIVSGRDIFFISDVGEELQTVNFEDISKVAKFSEEEKNRNYYMQRINWSDGNSFWLELQDTGVGGKVVFIEIIAETWEIKTYDVPHANAFYDINIDNQMVVSSNYPLFYTEESIKEFISESPEISLFLYDLNTKQERIILTSDAGTAKNQNTLNPKWLDEKSFIYEEANSDKKIIYTIE